MRRPLPRFVGVLLLGAAILGGSAYAASCPLACSLKDLTAIPVAATQAAAANVTPPAGSGDDCAIAPLLARLERPALAASPRSEFCAAPAMEAKPAIVSLAGRSDPLGPPPPGSSRLEPVLPLRI